MQPFSLAEEMLEFEVHELRRALTATMTEVQQLARQYPDNQPLRDLAVVTRLRRRQVAIHLRLALRSKAYRCRRPAGSKEVMGI